MKFSQDGYTFGKYYNLQTLINSKQLEEEYF